MTSGVAVAQEGDEGPLEEIVVTATFRETRLQETPIAITAVTGDMLDLRSQTNIYQVANQAPNVTLKPGGIEKGPMIIAYIRGVGQSDFNYATEPGVGIYVDDVVYASLTGSLIELLDLDRVEIARGPQGTLAGRNSIGGAVRLFSRKPGEDSGGNVQVTFGDFNRVDVRGAADITLAEDKLYARISGASRSRDGYVTRLDYNCMHPGTPIPSYMTGASDRSGCVLGTEGGISYTAGRAALRWIASDNFEANLSFDMTNDTSEAAPGVLFQVNEVINNPNHPDWPLPPGSPDAPPGHPNGFSTAGVGTETGTFFDIDGDLSTTGDREYYDNRYVTWGPFRGDSVVNDPYVNYSTYLDPNAPLPTRPFSPSAVPPINHLDQWGASLTLDWQLNDNYSIKSITAYRDYIADFAQDADQSPLNSQMLLQHVWHEQFTQELRLNGSFSNFDFTLGGFYLDQEGFHEANVNLYYIQLNFIHGPDPTPSDSKAVFGHVNWGITDALSLSAGVRYTEDTKDYTYFRRNIDGSQIQACALGFPFFFWDIGQPPNCGLFDPFTDGGVPLFNITEHFESTRTDYRVALDYRFTDDFMAYGSFSSGYKGGGINPRPFFIIQIETFEPETMDTWEIGFKAELFDRRMRLNAAYFVNDYQDIQITQLVCELPFTPPGVLGPPCLQPGNAGEADVDGFEVEMEWHPTDNFLIDAMVSSLNFEYQTVNPATAVSLDMITPYTPELTWSLGAQYSWEIGTAGTMTARVDAAYQDEIYTDPLNHPRNLLEDYTLVNARLTWRSDDDDWEAALEVTNLTDELYHLTQFFGQWTSGGTISGSPGQPRMWAVSLRRNFD